MSERDDAAADLEHPPPIWDSWSSDPADFPEELLRPLPSPDATDASDDEATEQVPRSSDSPADPREEDLADTQQWLQGPATEQWVLPEAEVPTRRRPTPTHTAPAVELPTIHRDQMVADRYRLEEQLAEREDTLTWRAFDTKLSRAVLTHVLSPDDPRKDAVLKAAKSSAIATDSRFLRVLDAVDSPGERGTYIVCEYVPGISLETMLQQGPLSALEAAWVVREVADALTPMHAQGLFHGALNPDTVVITATGSVKIVGFLIDAALARHDTGDWTAREETDVEALGKLLYASLVTRWPTLERSDQLHWGLAAAPADQQGWLTPRQVRAGVSPALDAICDEILHDEPRLGGQPLRSVAQIDRALSQILGTADASGDLEHRVRHPQATPSHLVEVQPAGAHTRPEPNPDAAATQVQPAVDDSLDAPERPLHSFAAEPRHPSQRRRDRASHPQRDAGAVRPRPAQGRPWLTALIGLVGLALLIGLIGVALRQGRRDEAGQSPSPSGPSAPTVKVHPIAKVDDFDPTHDGGNDEENPNQVKLAWDGKPDTAWQTLTYLNRATFGGLKPGVGLVVDLGQPVEVGAVKLTLQGTPTGVQLRIPTGDPTSAQASMKAAKDWKTIAQSPKSGTQVTLTPASPVTTRHLLVYITSLPNVGANKYRAAIAEIEVTS